jgi:ankyrin repeat protein
VAQEPDFRNMGDSDDFFSAIERGDRATVEKLLQSNPDLAGVARHEGATPLHFAAFHGQREIVELLLSAGADINVRDDEYNATPAGWAIHYLRERGALLAIEIEDLLFAVERGDVEWAERFLTRHPWLVHARARGGRLIADYAATNPELAALFDRFARNNP